MRAYVTGVASRSWLSPASRSAQAPRASRPTSRRSSKPTRAAPGRRVRAALQVTLPDGYHVKSNKPRDPTAHPDRADRRRSRRASTVAEIVYPPATDLKQVGADEPLAVFEREFAIGVRSGSRGDRRARRLNVPGAAALSGVRRRRCAIPPTTADAEWTLHVVPRRTRPPQSRTPDVFDAIAFGRGEAPPQIVAAASPAAHASGGAGQPVTGRRKPRRLHRPRHHRRLSRHGRLPRVHSQRRERRQERGMFEGRGPLAILLLVFLGGLALNLTPCVLPMIPINLAIIGAGAQAGSRGRGFLLGGAYGAAMAVVYGVLGADRDPDGRHVRHDQLVALVQPRHRRAVRRARRSRCSTWSTIDFSRFSSGIRSATRQRGHVSRRVQRWARSPRCSRARASRRS